MSQTEIRVASYNIRKARGLDQMRRPERTLEVINQLNADIVVLQEADKRLGMRKPAIPRAMIDRETDFQLLDASSNGVSLGWHGNAILIRDPSLVLRVQRIVLSGLEPRGAVRIDLDIDNGLTIVAVHLGLLRRDRQTQLCELNEMTSDAANTIIAGDFNEWSQTKGLEPLSNRFQTCSPGQTFHARRPVAGLDRFALSGGIEMRDAGVAQGNLAKKASDHLPIWSDISLNMASTTY